MRLFLLTSLTMVAFAANSVLNRLALADGSTGAAEFSAIRLVSGALMLAFLISLKKDAAPRKFDPLGAGALALYAVGFSFAYVSLDTGVGALILFGGVQVTMFAGALILREAVPLQRWLGAGLAFSGLLLLLWPTGVAAPSLTGGLLMTVAALGWGVYSLIGRGAAAPLEATTWNFVLAAPIGVIVWLIFPGTLSPDGVLLAIVSGAVTSGLGYALWYSVLPGLGAARAGVAQMTVPVIAAAGGAVLLGEALSLRFAVATAVVLAGVALSITAKVAPVDRS